MKELFNFEDTVKKRKMIFAEIRVDRVIFYAVDLEKKTIYYIHQFLQFHKSKKCKGRRTKIEQNN